MQVTDEVLKIRVAEALEYVNEITQPDYDVVENELEKRIQEDLHDMRHDELFQMNFSDRRMFGSMVAMLPLGQLSISILSFTFSSHQTRTKS